MHASDGNESQKCLLRSGHTDQRVLATAHWIPPDEVDIHANTMKPKEKRKTKKNESKKESRKRKRPTKKDLVSPVCVRAVDGGSLQCRSDGADGKRVRNRNGSGNRKSRRSWRRRRGCVHRPSWTLQHSCTCFRYSSGWTVHKSTDDDDDVLPTNTIAWQEMYSAIKMEAEQQISIQYSRGLC